MMVLPVRGVESTGATSSGSESDNSSTWALRDMVGFGDIRDGGVGEEESAGVAFAVLCGRSGSVVLTSWRTMPDLYNSQVNIIWVSAWLSQ